MTSELITIQERTKCGVFSCRGKLAKPQRKRPTLKLILGINFNINFNINPNKLEYKL